MCAIINLADYANIYGFADTRLVNMLWQLPGRCLKALKTLTLYSFRGTMEVQRSMLFQNNNLAIVRGKAKAPVEFGAKLDLSIDENGIARLERLSFDAYNESDVLIAAVENYKSHTGHYPERVLVDQIYRNRTNRAFCSEHGIYEK